jgi:hypothetical protein
MHVVVIVSVGLVRLIPYMWGLIWIAAWFLVSSPAMQKFQSIKFNASV